MADNCKCPECGHEFTFFKVRKHMYCPKCNVALISNNRFIGFISIVIAGISSAVIMTGFSSSLNIEQPLLAAKFLTLPMAFLVYYFARKFGFIKISKENQ